jgi:hypothetical protein
MILDFQQPTMIEGIIAFPDFAFANLPAQASDIKETNSIVGSVGTALSITGSVSRTSQSTPTPPFPGT